MKRLLALSLKTIILVGIGVGQSQAAKICTTCDTMPAHSSSGKVHITGVKCRPSGTCRIFDSNTGKGHDGACTTHGKWLDPGKWENVETYCSCDEPVPLPQPEPSQSPSATRSSKS